MTFASETVLVVDDEPIVLNTLLACVRRAGYLALGAANAREALSIAARHPCPIHLVVCDVQLPDLDGPDLALAFLGLRPQTPFLFVAGNPDHPVVVERVRRPGKPFLAKPFLPSELADAMAQVLSSIPALRHASLLQASYARHV